MLSGPTTGHALTEDGLRLTFRTHRLRPDTPQGVGRLHYTHGTELACPGNELLVLRDLMGRTSYVHPSATTLADEYAAPSISIEVMMSTARKPVLSPAPGGQICARTTSGSSRPYGSLPGAAMTNLFRVGERAFRALRPWAGSHETG